MTKKINQLIKKYKYKKNSPAEIKTELTELLHCSESFRQAKVLLALLFGENHNINDENIPQEYITAIINGTILNPGFKPEKRNLLIYKNKIIATNSNIPDSLPDKDLRIINAEGLIITPGFVDQHIHGGYGCNFNNSSVEEIINLACQLPKHGITSILPTIMTAPEIEIKEQINKIKIAKKNLPENSTKFHGIHLEGPYLSGKYKGIQPESYILLPEIENFKIIEDPEIKIVTYAPELDKNFALTKYLSNKNIIASAGHSNASAENIKKAEEAGLKQITHLFNAMSPLHHRNPGILGEALTNNNLYVEVIADGLHLDPIIIDLVLRAKPCSRIIFISDSLPLNRADRDSVIFGGQKIFKKDNRAINADGTLAGSLIFLDSSVKNLHKWDLASFSDALKFTSQNIFQNIGLDNYGYIDRGKMADLVMWDMEKDYQVNTTIINGQIAFLK